MFPLEDSSSGGGVGSEERVETTRSCVLGMRLADKNMEVRHTMLSSCLSV